MLRSLAIFVAGAVLGTAFGVALGFFLFPFIFPPPPAAEQLTTTDRASVVLAQGTFIHANPSDPIHWGKGSASVRADSVFLGEDFEVGPGPKFHVYLVPEGADPLLGRSRGADVRRPRPSALLQGQPALRHSRRRRPCQVSERDHLVRAVLGADLAGRSDAQRLIDWTAQDGLVPRHPSKARGAACPYQATSAYSPSTGRWTAAGLATVPCHVPDLVPVDADIAQHPLVQAAQRPAWRAGPAQLGHHSRNRAAKPAPRPACSFACRRLRRGPERPIALERQ